MREVPSSETREGAVDPGSDVVEAVMTAYEAIVAAPVRRVVAAGFGDVTPAILSAMLAIPGAGIDLAELGRLKGRSKQATSHVVAELRRRGYVDLVVSAVDGRAKVVIPTARGRLLRESGLEARMAMADVAADVMGRDASKVATILLAFADAALDLRS